MALTAPRPESDCAFEKQSASMTDSKSSECLSGQCLEHRDSKKTGKAAKQSNKLDIFKDHFDNPRTHAPTCHK